MLQLHKFPSVLCTLRRTHFSHLESRGAKFFVSHSSGGVSNFFTAKLHGCFCGCASGAGAGGNKAGKIISVSVSCWEETLWCWSGESKSKRSVRLERTSELRTPHRSRQNTTHGRTSKPLSVCVSLVLDGGACLCATATMDRTMYGKIEPGTLHPFRCAKKGLDSPGCEFYIPLVSINEGFNYFWCIGGMVAWSHYIFDHFPRCSYLALLFASLVLHNNSSGW